MPSSLATPELTLLHEANDAAREAASSLMTEDEFRAFYERTSRPLWVYLARVTGDRSIADDLLQESYYRFFRAAIAYASESHRRNSLFRIATNLARDAWRRSGGVATDTLDDSLAAAGDGRVEEKADLARAMARLAPRQREMLWLAYANGSSHEEIAEAVGVARGSVKGLLLRARKKLALMLGVAPPVEGRQR